MIEFLKDNPIIQIACQKMKISRSTHYEWCKKDLVYRAKVAEALLQGVNIVNDVAEHTLISAIKNGDTRISRYWLEHHHPAYATRPLQKHVERLIIKPGMNEEFVQLIRKYAPDFVPNLKDIYMTEDEWRQQLRDAERTYDPVKERLRAYRKPQAPSTPETEP